MGVLPVQAALLYPYSTYTRALVLAVTRRLIWLSLGLPNCLTLIAELAANTFVNGNENSVTKKEDFRKVLRFTELNDSFKAKPLV